MTLNIEIINWVSPGRVTQGKPKTTWKDGRVLRMDTRDMTDDDWISETKEN